MKKRIKRIVFYDFDATLFKSFDQTNIEKWEKKSNKTLDLKNDGEWWVRPESLDTKIFDFKPYKKILNLLVDDLKDENTYAVLLTNRDIKLRNYVLKILKDNSIVFDDYSFKDNNKKTDRINNYLKKFSDTEIIVIYDDRKKELDEFIKFKKENKDKYLIKIYKAKEGNVELIESKIQKIIDEEIKLRFKYL